MSLEDLYRYADYQNIDVYHLPCGDCAFAMPPNVVVVDPASVNKEILAHEIGHIQTGGFYSLSSDKETIRKCEEEATRFGINLIISRKGFIELSRDDYVTPWMVSEYYQISEKLAEKVIKYFNKASKYHIKMKS